MNREAALEKWLQPILGSECQWVALPGDASLRRYFRVYCQNKQYIVMDAPPPETPVLFMNIARILSQENVRVPEILASELEKGFLLLSDFGDRLYLNELNEQTADVLYADAFRALIKMQHSQAEVPSFDHHFLKRQFGIFEEWYLKKHKGLTNTTLSSQFQKCLYPIYETISQIILMQPKVFVHRDYHSRNLMILEEDNPGILDFQDAMRGPITYDLVSLLQDCYIAWPRERVLYWIEEFRVRAIKAGILSGEAGKETFVRWFDWTGLQRHLKNLGIFSRLFYRDGKAHYLKDIPQVLQYIATTCERYPELLPLGSFFETLEGMK